MCFLALLNHAVSFSGSEVTFEHLITQPLFMSNMIYLSQPLFMSNRQNQIKDFRNFWKNLIFVFMTIKVIFWIVFKKLIGHKCEGLTVDSYSRHTNSDVIIEKVQNSTLENKSDYFVENVLNSDIENVADLDNEIVKNSEIQNVESDIIEIIDIKKPSKKFSNDIPQSIKNTAPHKPNVENRNPVEHGEI